MLKRVLPEQAVIGMYVQGFEGSWLSHPFWRKGFVLEAAADVQKIIDAGLPFFIDSTRGIDASALAPAEPVRSARRALPNRAPPSRALAGRAPVARKVVQFGKADQERAVETARRTASIVQDVFKQMRGGRSIEVNRITSAVADVAAAIDYDPAIFLSATRLRAKSERLYMHSVAVCALSINLANTLRLPVSASRELGIGALLHDVGKLALTGSVHASASELSPAELAEMRTHPERGHAMLLNIPGVPSAALDVCLNHHERFDGSGYPTGMIGEALSQNARLVAICNDYDTRTSRISGRAGMSPVDAVTAMAADDGAFDPALLFKFMQSIGVMPTGMLVRLRSNRLAVTMPSSRVDSVQRFRAFYSTLDAAFVPFEDVVSSDGSWDGPINGEDASRWFAEDWATLRTRILAGARLPALDPPATSVRLPTS